ncbi:MAG: hypothetical protein ACRDWI_08845 [Jiangellaceae bacterium]
MEERLDATFRARTYGDLEPITRHLPQGPYPLPGLPGPAPGPHRAGPSTRLPAARFERITTVLGDARRRGRWEVPSRLEVTCLLGEVVLDSTEAILRHREIVVQVGAILGSVTLIVPDVIDVRMDVGPPSWATPRAGLVVRSPPAGRCTGYAASSCWATSPCGHGGNDTRCSAAEACPVDQVTNRGVRSGPRRGRRCRRRCSRVRRAGGHRGSL